VLYTIAEEAKSNMKTFVDYKQGLRVSEGHVNSRSVCLLSVLAFERREGGKPSEVSQWICRGKGRSMQCGKHFQR
jgi:hypothetical protein